MNGLPIENDEPAWRKLKLTLERPYTDDQGNPIRQLLDVTPEGQQIYEPCARLTLILRRLSTHTTLQGPRSKQAACRKHP